MTDVLVCIKRVPETSGEVLLSEDAMSVDARHVGYTVSPHELCALELAVQITAANGGEVTVVSLGTEAAIGQLRDAVAVGAHHAVLLEADSDGYDPAGVAAVLADVARDFDLVILGNDAADTGDFQVPVRLAYLLGRPVVTGISTVSVEGDTVTATGDGPDGTELYELPLPAVVAVMEGGASPRYPSVVGRMKAKKATIDVRTPSQAAQGSGRLRLKLLPAQPSQVVVLGEGAAAAPALVDVLESLGVLSR
jgi:electron transfer flavoprotein beta subunit